MPDSIILGIGLDLVEVKRMRASVRRSGERFSKRVFTPEEIAYCAGRARKFEHLAARFAAKEAALKALGTGITGWASMQEVEVVHDAAGRPEIRLSGGVLRRARSLGVTATHLSISHTERIAAAMVILEGRRRRRGLG
jgi:holo-[acyl-carrier protein] synthase